jgi:hypothetical protein
MTGVRDYSTGELKHNVVALAKAAKALKVPIFVTTTARDSMWGQTFPELLEAPPGVEIIDRSSVNPFDDAGVARAIEATGRKKLIFAGNEGPLQGERDATRGRSAMEGGDEEASVKGRPAAATQPTFPIGTPAANDATGDAHARR